MERINKVRINSASKNIHWLTLILGFLPNQELDNVAEKTEPCVKVYSTFKGATYQLCSYDYIVTDVSHIVDISKR